MATPAAGAGQFGATRSLFARGPIVAEEPGTWRVWTPDLEPVPEKHPFGRHCHNGLFMPSRTYPRTHSSVVPMCLIDNDWVSNNIRQWGSWPDCRLLLHLWERSGAGVDGARPDDIFVDIGANIGACTVELLARTNATVIAVEPNPANLYHLTRTLKMASSHKRPDFASRVAVLPVGLGPSPAWSTIVADVKNSGNSVIKGVSSHPMRYRDGAGVDNVTVELPVRVLPLDTLLPSGFGARRVRLMKLDVQGSECSVLSGAVRLLGDVEAITAEYDPSQHRSRVLNGCEPETLRSLLRRNGFSLSSRMTMGEATVIGHRGAPVRCPRGGLCLANASFVSE